MGTRRCFDAENTRLIDVATRIQHVFYVEATSRDHWAAERTEVEQLVVNLSPILRDIFKISRILVRQVIKQNR